MESTENTQLVHLCVRQRDCQSVLADWPLMGGLRIREVREHGTRVRCNMSDSAGSFGPGAGC